LINKFFYLKGGAETVFFQERDFLKNNNIPVVDFSMQDDLNFISPHSGSFVSYIGFREPKGLLDNLWRGLSFIHSHEAVKKLDRLLELEKPDIAHLHNVYHQLTPSIIPVLKQHGVKIVMTLHDYKLICPAYSMLDHDRICSDCAGKDFWKAMKNNCQGSLAHSVLMSLESYWHRWRKSYDGVDLFIAPSQFMANMASMRVPERKIRVVRNGVDTESVNPSYDDEGYALYFGRLSIEKGLQTLLKSHAMIKEKIPLKIVGTGPLMPKGKHDGQPEFLGYRTGKDLQGIIARSSFVVVPSECNENCSMSVIEAMAHGKPVIGTRIAGIPEQIEDGQTGFLFNMGNAAELSDKMTALALDKDMRMSMGRASRTKVERDYSFSEHGAKILALYQELLRMQHF
jgi:glycosyltransferase involved in cell wall biosynthesis